MSQFIVQKAAGSDRRSVLRIIRDVSGAGMLVIMGLFGLFRFEAQSVRWTGALASVFFLAVLLANLLSLASRKQHPILRSSDRWERSMLFFFFWSMQVIVLEERSGYSCYTFAVLALGLFYFTVAGIFFWRYQRKKHN